MPRGRKKKYVRPRIECDCDYCGKSLEYPYVHISLPRTGYIANIKQKGDDVVLNKQKTENTNTHTHITHHITTTNRYQTSIPTKLNMRK